MWVVGIRAREIRLVEGGGASIYTYIKVTSFDALLAMPFG
jgi:hypothetical protein